MQLRYLLVLSGVLFLSMVGSSAIKASACGNALNQGSNALHSNSSEGVVQMYPRPELTDTSQIKTLLIVLAMDVEANAVIRKIPDDKIVEKVGPLGVKYTEAFSSSRRILIAQSGVGTTAAGVNLSLIASVEQVDAVLLLGVGGALDPQLRVGDLVIGTSVVQHDAVFSSEEGFELMRPGALHLSLKPHQRPSPLFEAHPVMLDWLRRLVSMSSQDLRASEGVVLSGNEFVGSQYRKRSLGDLFSDSLLVEMESAGLAQIAHSLNIPFIVAKTVADRLDPHIDSGDDYRSFLEAAASNSSNLFSLIWGDDE